jgi:integrase
VAIGFELGIETGMRAGEMWSLERPQIDLPGYVVHLLRTKNGDTRDVSLSPRAVRLVKGLLSDGRTKLFTTSTAVRDALFRKARQAAGIEDLHFHDSRAEAVWRLSKKFDILELAEQIGHRDLKSLQLYFRDSATERAKKLRESPRRTPSPRRPPTAGSRSRSSA